MVQKELEKGRASPFMLAAWLAQKWFSPRSFPCHWGLKKASEKNDNREQLMKVSVAVQGEIFIYGTPKMAGTMKWLFGGKKPILLKNAEWQLPCNTGRKALLRRRRWIAFILFRQYSLCFQCPRASKSWIVFQGIHITAMICSRKYLGRGDVYIFSRWGLIKGHKTVASSLGLPDVLGVKLPEAFTTSCTDWDF